MDTPNASETGNNTSFLRGALDWADRHPKKAIVITFAVLAVVIVVSGLIGGGGSFNAGL